MKKALLFFSITLLFFGCKKSAGEKSGFLQQVSERSTWNCGTYVVAELGFIGGIVTEDGGMTNTQEFFVSEGQVENAHRMVGRDVVVSYNTHWRWCGPESEITAISLAE